MTKLKLAVLASVALTMTSAANAAEVVGSYGFTASDFYGGGEPETLPFQTVSGNYSFTFDTDSKVLQLTDLDVQIGSRLYNLNNTSFMLHPSSVGTLLVGLGNAGNISHLTDDFRLQVAYTPDFSSLDAGRTNGFLVTLASHTGIRTAATVDVFSTAAAPAVPEPSTWAMMLLGFGFVGGAMRSAKRKQKLTVSYA